MLRNYIKIAWRNIIRYKTNSLLNILGLTIGLASVMLIALYIQNELSYDTAFKDADRVYRVNMKGKMGDNSFYAGYTPPPAGEALVSNFPEIESATRIYQPYNTTVAYTNGETPKAFSESEILAVDPNFLEVLSYPLLKGDAATCLQQPNSIVITPQIAHKYFGSENPLGKTLLYGEEQRPLQVTGVLTDLEQYPASVKFDILMPVANFGDVSYFNWSWVWLNMATYVKLTKQASENPDALSRLEAGFPEMLRVQAAPGFKRIGQPFDEFLEKGNYWELHLQPLKDVHLYSQDITSSITEQHDVKSLYILGIIALFIVVLACVNFMNLATVQSVKRSKEIGIRKVLGSQRAQLVKQFMTEVVCYTFFAMLLAMVLVFLLLPGFNELTGKSIAAADFFNVELVVLTLAIATITAFLAGSYPAFFLTSFNPIHVLKGKGKTTKTNGLVRNGLVVFQFCIAIALISCTLIVFTQLRYTQQKDLGFDKENVLVLNNTERLGTGENSFKEELTAIPGVRNASSSSSMLTRGQFGDFYVPKATTDEPNIASDISLGSYLVDDEFIETLDLELTEGRAFKKEFNDSLSVLLNETAVAQIGWKNPIGKQLQYPGGNMEYYTVVGVLKDFNLESLHTAIEPFALFSETSQSYESGVSYITLKISGENTVNTLGQIEKLWEGYSESAPLEYTFLDEDLSHAYQEDRRLASLFTIFTALAIVVACLGLFGLIAFTAQQRSKEIGVRKVLGASVGDIVSLLAVNFLKLVLLALILAIPIAWLAMSKWLQDFVYRIDIPLWTFVVAGALALGIALITVSFQAIKAAIANPVKSLRTE
ncbi:ABC transporter permease [Leeuwenhoekiella nanhaiensis]|uniref:ABC transporter permease n=1 Tax=Leeuwenhoekiella nanhaiensis TaxID=1655491 RepID=A0A2G1VT10_9FLAO|nr:ABC transporter permease [Leeuwenhoekiella nanhaiensis]PHQ29912.1 ABC transporter permease [Leeuwenhoekiella nanhaiensis]